MQNATVVDESRAPRLLEPKKSLISVVLGALGFAGSFFTLNFSVSPFNLSINWFDFLPLLAGMAFGGRYGLLASTIGLGAVYPFFIWPEDGWACLLTSVMLACWTTANGYMRGLRQRRPAFWNHPLLVCPLSVLVFNSIVYVFFPIAMRLNPPFWNPKAELGISTSTLRGLVIKESLVLLTVMMFEGLLLMFPAARRLFGLEVKKESRYNGRVALIIMLGSFMVWSLFVLLDRALLVTTSPQGFLPISDPHEAVALVACVATGIILSTVIVSYQESRLKAEDSLATNKERLQLAVTAAGIGIWDWDPVRGVAAWDERMFAIYGIPKMETGDLREAWLSTVHPDDRQLVEDELRMSFLGQREYGPEFRIVRPDGALRYIKAASRALRDSEGKTYHIIGVDIDVTESKKAESSIKQSLAEKEILLREVHHRVKNNLQIICSLINLQQSDVEASSPNSLVLVDMESRVRAMSFVHEILYQPDNFTSVDFSSYVSNLCDHLGQAYAIDLKNVKLVMAIDPISLPLEKAVPCGLLINELVVNALKHAFPDDRSGAIKVTMSRAEGDMVLLTVGDDGIGAPQLELEDAKRESIGMDLVKSLAEQLGGSHRIESSQSGVLISVGFPA